MIDDCEKAFEAFQKEECRDHDERYCGDCDRYREAFYYCWKNHVEPIRQKEIKQLGKRIEGMEHLAEMADRLKRDNRKLRGTVTFYADRDNWINDKYGHTIWDDGNEVKWDKARQCLEELDNENDSN